MFASPIMPEPVIVVTERKGGDLSIVVLSPTVLELRTIRRFLTEGEQAVASRFYEAPSDYISGQPDEADQAEGFVFRDEWIFAPLHGDTVEIVETGDGEVWAIARDTMPEDEVRHSSDDLSAADLLDCMSLEDGLRGWVFRRSQYMRAA